MIDKFAWSPQMALGIPAIDDAHKAFIEEVAHLADVPDPELGTGFSTLIAGLERHFHEEEALMDEIEFPALQSHREQHARVLGALHHAVPELMRGDCASARKALELLPQWFLLHLSTMDMALAVTLDMEDVKEHSLPIQTRQPSATPALPTQ